MSGVTAVPGTGPEVAVSVDGASVRTARRSRPLSRLSPSPVRHGERRSRWSRENRGAGAAVATSPALEGGQRRRSRPVGEGPKWRRGRWCRHHRKIAQSARFSSGSTGNNVGTHGT
ncbi:Hypothetical predicted protein [Pelobates cultripes]|uniref:Uncharacterized protein n=1 Tax=Pelobates cultripes TaxID=61616 RepID=A0AAD1VR12_PELCU|nr:Hypothetical predicted protein [Pelobates cultripes]